jgi:YidC/Oxa1 family membrane protein insertase
MPIRGPAIYDGKKYQKLDVDRRRRLSSHRIDQWLDGEMQHHFVSAAVPPPGEAYDFTLRRRRAVTLLTYRGPLKTVPAGATRRFSETLFVGPKLQSQLERWARSSS